ncbi:MAG TPA: hypothetical protein VN963_00840, partial [bacterium]|nr:hypothetical protein [bacterium]
MSKQIFQLFLNRFKASGVLSSFCLFRILGLLCACLLAPVWAVAQPAPDGTNPVLKVLNPTLTSYNEPVSVVLDYCEPAYTSSPAVILLNVNDNGNTTITSCSVPVLGNYYWIDYYGTQQEDQSLGGYDNTAPGPDGYGFVINNVSETVPQCGAVTYVEYLPSGLSNNCGTFNVVAAISNSYLACGSGQLNGNATVTVPCTSSAVTAFKSVQGTTASAGDLLLFSVNYQYVNDSSNFVVTDTVPPNTTLVGWGPGTPTGAVAGAAAGTLLTWTFPANNSPATVTSGSAWMLVQVNTGVTAGTVISNTANYSPVGSTSASLSTNMVSANSTQGGFTLQKSESASTLTTGASVTYTLAYKIDQSSLQFYDSYDTDSVGAANGTIAGGPGVTGFDDSGYTLVGAGTCGGNTWQVASDSNGDHYIDACSTTSANSTGPYPALLRDSPVSLCSGTPYILQGNMEIPVNAPGATGSAPAA